MSESPEGLDKSQIAGPYLQSFNKNIHWLLCASTLALGAKATMMATVPAAKFLFVMLSDLIPYCQTFLISVLSGDPHSS